MKKIVLLLMFGMNFCAEHALAENVSADVVWTKPTPVFKQKFDWLRLSSDEWLKGDIITMYDEELEFDSVELDMLYIDWEDVVELRSKDILSIRMDNGDIHEGYLVIKDGTLTIVNGESTKNRPLKNLLSIASSEAKESNLWDGEVNLGANIKGGNTEQIDYSFSAELKRRSSTSRFITNFIANFSRSKNKDTNENIETINSQDLSSYFDWFVNQRMFFRVASFDYYSDKFQNIDYRVTLGFGLGAHIINNKRTTWDFIIGPSYQYTSYQETELDEHDSDESPVLMIGTMYEYDFTKDIDFETTYQIQLVNEDSGKYIHYLKTGVEIELTNDFDLDITLHLDRTEEPHADADGKEPEKNDYRLIISLGYEF